MKTFRALVFWITDKWKLILILLFLGAFYLEIAWLYEGRGSFFGIPTFIHYWVSIPFFFLGLLFQLIFHDEFFGKFWSWLIFIILGSLGCLFTIQSFLDGKLTP